MKTAAAIYPAWTLSTVQDAFHFEIHYCFIFCIFIKISAVPNSYFGYRNAFL